MDIKTIDSIEYDMVEQAPKFHELLAIRGETGRPVLDMAALDFHQKQLLFTVSIRLRSKGTVNSSRSMTPPLVAIATVVGEPSHFYVQDFIVRPEYQGYGFSRMLLDKVMEYINKHVEHGVVCIDAHGDDENLCRDYGFSQSHGADLGPNMVKVVA